MTSTNLKVCLLITKADKVLLIKEKSAKENAYKWNIVKGTVGDENIVDAALREAKEEVDVTIKLNKSLGVYVKYYGDNKYTVYFAYSAIIVEGEPKITDYTEMSGSTEDIIKVKWFTKEELKLMKEADFILDVSYLLIKRYLDGVELSLDAVTVQDLSAG